MIHILYSAPYDLPITFASPEFYAYKLRDSDCFRVFENTTSHSMSVHDKKSPITGSVIKEGDHNNLMIRLSETLPENSTLILQDVITLGSDEFWASAVVDRMFQKNVQLEFIDSPWMNMNAMNPFFSVWPSEARTAYMFMLSKTIQWKNNPTKRNSILDPAITQASSKAKKNCI